MANRPIYPLDLAGSECGSDCRSDVFPLLVADEGQHLANHPRFKLESLVHNKKILFIESELCDRFSDIKISAMHLFFSIGEHSALR